MHERPNLLCLTSSSGPGEAKHPDKTEPPRLHQKWWDMILVYNTSDSTSQAKHQGLQTSQRHLWLTKSQGRTNIKRRRSNRNRHSQFHSTAGNIFREPKTPNLTILVATSQANSIFTRHHPVPNTQWWPVSRAGEETSAADCTLAGHHGDPPKQKHIRSSGILAVAVYEVVPSASRHGNKRENGQVQGRLCM